MDAFTDIPSMVGLHGHARVGKDTVADQMSILWGFDRFAVADRIRDELYELDPVLGSDQTVRSLVDEVGWDAAKVHRFFGPEVRRLMQVLGDVGRSLSGDRVWLDAMWSDIEVTGGCGAQRRVVVSDVRSDVEASSVLDRGGSVLQVVRPGTGRANTHHTESGIDPRLVSAVVSNDGSIGGLPKRIEAALRSLERQPAIRAA